MKNILLLSLLFFSLTIFSQPTFDIEGHRGCRGLYPENTLVAFIEAVKLGVNTLEMDVVVSKDGKLVVSHDPIMNAEICSIPDGNAVSATDKFRIYNLNYEEIKKFDCGFRGNSKFLEQKKIASFKPLLSDVIDSVEKFIRQNNLPPVQYNIETKSTIEGDDVDHPKPAVFAKLLYNLLKEKNVLNKCIIQSFDPRTLQVVHQLDANTTTALLVFNADGFEKNISQLGFAPTIYSPNFILVNKKLIRKCHQQKIKIIPWTVNEEDKMKSLKKLGVDGIISDYPDRAIKVLR
ncbi:MAG: glycerophosphodiester phosphodiesterase family protein [Bacteroidetes bacterium]|nr:glycerophosphodiester phosphodiesterase family protein [Bacteroidota bacterium]